MFVNRMPRPDMHSSSPSFGTPESAIGLLCAGQIARRFGLPWRSAGALWQRNGGADAAARAGRIWRETLERYEQPPMDQAARAQIEAFVVRRRAELGD
jgi:trimethylamine:corrinoid methyltransferase-like protein